MIKIAIASHRLLGKISKIPFLRNFFVYRFATINGSSLNISDDLYRFIPMSNRTSKETTAHRFSDLDAIAVKYISNDAVVHDVAVSNGITSVELFDELIRQGKRVKFIVSDKFSEYRITRGTLNGIIDADRKLVGVYLFGVYASGTLPGKYFLSKFLFRLLSHIRSVCRPEDECESDKVLLFCSELNEYIASGDIKCIQYDVFSSELRNQFDYIRCMNLLNLSYFNVGKLSDAVNNILLSLREGGIFQVGRTHKDGSNHADFYIKENAKMKLLMEINSGSEIRNLIACTTGQKVK